MLNFEEKFNLSQNINNYVEKTMLKYNETLIKVNKISSKDVQDLHYSKAKVIGYECNNMFLYTWKCKEHPVCKTYLAIYDLMFNESKLIYTHSHYVDICNATINNEASLVAFCLIEKTVDYENLESSTNNSTNENIFYKSYIAEISPQNNVFSLNIASSTYQKLKFIYFQNQLQTKKSHLLFMHHKKMIELYNIPLALVDSSYILSEKPATQQIVRKFLWSQYDEHSKRLYYVNLLPQDEDEIDAIALFTVIEFKLNGDFEYVLNFPLPMNFKMSCFDNSPNIYDHKLSNILSCVTFNMIVLTSKTNAFYICYQHPMKLKVVGEMKTPDTISENSSKTSLDELADDEKHAGDLCSVVSYTICCIHSAYKLQCTSSIENHSKELISSPGSLQLLFTLFNDYVIVYLQNSFLHLLDIGTEHEPVHNLLLKTEDLIPLVQLNSMFSVFYNTISPSNHAFLIYDNYAQIAYDVKLNQKNMFRYFLSANTSTRLSILHCCMVHLTDKKLTKKIMERICQDSANIETFQLLKEYLLSASYVQMKKLVAYSVDAKVFPFTSQELYRGQVERNSNGNRTVFLFYKNFGDNLNKQLQKVLSKSTSIYWKNVYSLLSFEIEHRNKRFPIKALYLANSKSFLDTTCRRSSINNSSVLHGSPITSLREVRNRSVSSSSSLPVAVVNNFDENEVSDTKRTNNIVSEILVNYLMKVYGNELKSKATNMCREYALNQNRSIYGLWKIALRSLEFHRNASSLVTKSLMIQPDTYEISLFQILERLNLLVEELCLPRFPGMKSIFFILGVRCLSREQFLQYLNAYVFEITVELAIRIVNEISNVTDDWKYKCLSHLSKEQAYQVLQEWENYSAKRYLAQLTILKVPSEPVFPTSNSSEFQDNIESFIPTETLLEAVKSHKQSNNSILRRNNTDFSEATKTLISNAVLSSTEMLRRDIQR